MELICKRFIANVSGATVIEYALVAAMMSVALLTTIITFGPSLTLIFAPLGERLSQEATHVR